MEVQQFFERLQVGAEVRLEWRHRALHYPFQIQRHRCPVSIMIDVFAGSDMPAIGADFQIDNGVGADI